MYRLHLQNTYDFEITNAKTNQFTICQEAQQAISFSLSMIHISSFLKKKVNYVAYILNCSIHL